MLAGYVVIVVSVLSVVYVAGTMLGRLVGAVWP